MRGLVGKEYLEFLEEKLNSLKDKAYLERKAYRDEKHPVNQLENDLEEIENEMANDPVLAND